jgi:hypothetical protein
MERVMWLAQFMAIFYFPDFSWADTRATFGKKEYADNQSGFYHINYITVASEVFHLLHPQSVDTYSQEQEKSHTTEAVMKEKLTVHPLNQRQSCLYESGKEFNNSI